MDQDDSQRISDVVRAAYQDKTPLRVEGGNTKCFYGRQANAPGARFSTASHCGIVSYEPTELVITARAGTPLTQIEQTLYAQQQMLAFEPPYYGPSATLGGTIACNFSGPRRAYTGAARDYVLGSRVVNGKGEKLRFGGEVMKNVAGYDASRLMCGAMGTLGVLLDVSLKVLPRPELEETIVLNLDFETAMRSLQNWTQRAFPVSASCYDGEHLMVRLSGYAEALGVAKSVMGGELLSAHENFWQNLKEQKLAYFESEKPLWRLSLAATAPPLLLRGESFYEWGGSLRWLLSDQPAGEIRAVVEAVGGHATQYRSNEVADDVFHPLSPALHTLHRRLKGAFDPSGVLNPGRMYPAF